jgi:Skp family chaperone for outer membrane proteins
MMKNFGMAALVATMFLLSAPAAFAADAPATSQIFGVIDTGRVLQGSAAAKSVSEALEAKRKEFASQITKEQDALRTEGQKFEKSMASMDKEQAAARRKDLNEKVYNLQKMMQSREILLEKALNGSMNKLRAETTSIVGELAKERGLSAVLTQDAVMLSIPQMDITDEVIKRLDDKVKSIPIDWNALGKEAKEEKEKKAK